MIKRSHQRLGGFFLAFVPLLITACSNDPATTLASANSELAENDFISAKLHLLTYLKEKPDHSDAWLKLARSELFLGRGPNAESALERAQKSGVPEAEIQDLFVEALLLQEKTKQAYVAITRIPSARLQRAFLLRGRAHAIDGDAEKALGSLAEGLAKYPGDSELLAETARVHLAQNDIVRAETSAKAALKANPKSHEALLVNGDLALAQGRPQQAFDYFAATLRVWPVSVRALIGRAAAEGDLGRLDVMAKTLDKINGIDEDQPLAGLLRAQLLAKQGKWNDVLQIIEVLGPELSRQPLLFRLEGEAAYSKGLYERAAKALQRYVAQRPSDRKAVMLLAQSQLAVKDPVAARETLARFADSASASPAELRLMSKIALALKLPAASAYEAKAQIPHPAFLADRIGRGNAALTESRWAEAIDVYEELNEATGGADATLNNNLGWAQYKAGRADAALKQLSKAYKQAPRNAAIAHSYGTVLLATGRDKQKAFALLTKAAELAPQNPRYAMDLKKATGSN